MERAVDPVEVAKRWDLYKLPKSMVGKTFLDIGCWGGQFCVEALDRGAELVLGVDLVWGEKWNEMLSKNWRLQFLCNDVFSQAFLDIPVFDVVLCAGVLYHVTDPIGLLRRVKAKAEELIVLETAFHDNKVSPCLVYCPDDSYGGDWSNWFVPNTEFLRLIAKELGMEILDSFGVGGNRLCLHWIPHFNLSRKNFPRNPKYMRNSDG